MTDDDKKIEEAYFLNTPGGNYVNLLREKLDLARKLHPVGLTEIQVMHDKWCAFNMRKPCNCNPDISIKGKKV